MTVRIGLEVHVPLNTEAKLFCACPAGRAEAPNTAICPTCTGQPGARPQGVNRRALALALQLARLLACTPEPSAAFQRKHYVYPDLPNNYQRTSTPLGVGGRFWDVRVAEVHVEEDPGAYDPESGLVDLNRSGTPLVEIVTEPDLTDPEDVATWLRVLRLTLERAQVLRPGAELKADVNVSLDGGERAEVKNVVGGRNAARAALHEVERQGEELRHGRTVPRETRHFDEDKGTTRPSRKKESVGDYRYMPDPDLGPLDLPAYDPGPVEGPSVPDQLRELTAELDLQLGEALALLEDEALEHLLARLRDTVAPGLAVEVCLVRLRGELDYRSTTLSALEVDEDLLVDLAQAWDDGAITKQVFTGLLRQALDGGDDVREALAAERRAGGDLDLEALAREVIEKNPGPVADYRAGKEEALNYLVGQIMQRTRGRADAREAREALRAILEA